MVFPPLPKRYQAPKPPPPSPKFSFGFSPHANLTAQELANILPQLVGKREIRQESWEQIDPQSRRHLFRK